MFVITCLMCCSLSCLLLTPKVLTYKVRRASELKVKFMLKCDQPGGRGGANLPPKGPQTQFEPEGGSKTMTMMIMMMMMMMMMMMILMMTMLILMCFLRPKGPQTQSAPGDTMVHFKGSSYAMLSP